VFYGNPGQLWIQILAVVAIGGYSFIMTLILGKIIDLAMGLRVEDNEEIEGLDTTQHEESGYRI
jgi:Amt family ammonium transporter